MKRICTICARGGSKGLPGKNLRPLLGKPLVAHSIEQARDTGRFDAIAVSSESDEILDVARQWGVEHAIKRPPEMATDAASKLPPIQHATRTVEEKMGTTFDVIVDLDVTAPLRNIDDIRGAIALLEKHNATNVLTAAPARKNPYFNILEWGQDGRLGVSKKQPGDRLERRQDSPECFDCNAAVLCLAPRRLHGKAGRVLRGHPAFHHAGRAVARHRHAFGFRFRRIPDDPPIDRLIAGRKPIEREEEE